MKYLKQYKIFESYIDKDEAESFIKDMLRHGVSDNDISCDVIFHNDLTETPCITITIGNHPTSVGTKRQFNLDDIKEDILNISEYLESENYYFYYMNYWIKERWSDNGVWYPVFISQKDYGKGYEKTLLSDVGNISYIIIQYRNHNQNESIKVPIEVGDTVLGGRFKNKKMIVKKIGKNKKGDITINDKPLLKFRLMKESLHDDINYYFRHLEDDDFVIELDDGEDYTNIFKSSSSIRIFKPLNNRGDSPFSYSNCKPFQWSEISSEVERYVDELDENTIDYIYILRIVSQVFSGNSGKRIHRDQVSIESLLDGSFNPGKILSFTIGLK